MRASAKRKTDLDRHIIQNRTEADRLDKLSTIQHAPSHAHERARVPAPAAVPTSFESPNSKTLLRGSYDEASRTLSLTFKRGSLTGDKLPVYDYTGVDPELWAEFVAAESKGTFFTEQVRPRFLGRQREPKKK